MQANLTSGHRALGLATRWLAGAAAVLVMAAALAGCGDDSSDGVSRSAGPTSEAQDETGHDEPSPVPEDARLVAVTARSFSFEPNEITARSGEAIAIELSSVDAEHDFAIDELDAHVSADAGSMAIGGFRAHEPGRFAFYCSVPGHRDQGMEGTLVVEAHG